MAKLLLIHWREDEAKERAKTLEAKGHEVRLEWNDGATPARMMRDELPDAVVIDLRRLPSHGRAVGTWLRGTARTRRVPLVFVEGEPEKTGRIARDFPDAVFTPWSRIATAVRSAIAHPPNPDPEAAARRASGSGYSGTPLWKKLDAKPGGRLLLLGAPKGFREASLADLPPDVTILTRPSGTAEVILSFHTRVADLDQKLATLPDRLAEKGGLWLAWPKKASGVATDLGDDVVRERGLATGLVDNKVCAVDSTWSALRFVRRTASKAGARSQRGGRSSGSSRSGK